MSHRSFSGSRGAERSEVVSKVPKENRFPEQESYPFRWGTWPAGRTWQETTDANGRFGRRSAPLGVFNLLVEHPRKIAKSGLKWPRRLGRSS